MNTRLYIIGNGFDLHHGIKSSYWNFKEYVEKHDKHLFELLEKYFNGDDLWSKFEETLENLDVSEIVEYASNYLVDYGADDWSDAFHHDYQYEVGEIIDAITGGLQQHFLDWILQLIPPNFTLLFLSKESKFLTFNYTPTLENLYGVHKDKILYIHNKAIDQDSILILGHGRNPSTIKSLNDQFIRDDEDEDYGDVRVREGNEILDEYFKTTYKNTQTILDTNEEFFLGLKDITEIYVLGHSLSEVDLGYFKRIVEVIDIKNVVWKVSCFLMQDIEKHRKTLTALGISKESIILDRLENIASNPNQLRLF